MNQHQKPKGYEHLSWSQIAELFPDKYQVRIYYDPKHDERTPNSIIILSPERKDKFRFASGRWIHFYWESGSESIGFARWKGHQFGVEFVFWRKDLHLQRQTQFVFRQSVSWIWIKTNTKPVPATGRSCLNTQIPMSQMVAFRSQLELFRPQGHCWRVLMA